MQGRIFTAIEKFPEVNLKKISQRLNEFQISRKGNDQFYWNSKGEKIELVVSDKLAKMKRFNIFSELKKDNKLVYVKNSKTGKTLSILDLINCYKEVVNRVGEHLFKTKDFPGAGYYKNKPHTPTGQVYK